MMPDVAADAGTPVWIYNSFDNTNNSGDWFADRRHEPSHASLGRRDRHRRPRTRRRGQDNPQRGKPNAARPLHVRRVADFHEIDGTPYDALVAGWGSPVTNLLTPYLAGGGTATELTVAAQPPSSIRAGGFIRHDGRCRRRERHDGSQLQRTGDHQPGKQSWRSHARRNRHRQRRQWRRHLHQSTLIQSAPATRCTPPPAA